MKPMFAKAKTQPVRVIYAEGEDERVLRAAQVVLEEKLARPILVGRPSVVEARHQALRPLDPRRARISTSSIPRTIRATAPTCSPMSRSPAAAA